MSESADERTAKWMVGDRLSCVLHLGDATLAYQLADQGHEVVVAGDDVSVARHPDISYVRFQGERLPFRSAAFDVVIVREVRDAPLALAEYARVLRHDGLLSTVSRRHDHSIPWMRKLREIVGARDEVPAPTDTFSASGLFSAPEIVEAGTWQRLDLPSLLTLAAEQRHPSVPESELARVRELFDSYGRQTGSLQLRTETTCLRARVDKRNLVEVEQSPEMLLLDLS